MHIAFRVDASHQIGTGHLMRCLTLADALRQREASICFVSRHMPEHLQKMIEDRGYRFNALPHGLPQAGDELAHSHWLGVSQQADAEATLQVLQGQAWDWLIVDHYALDARWESVLHAGCRRVMVIDDLADRMHDCDMLMDQNLYSDMHQRYRDKVTPDCQLLLGPAYALLKPDFGTIRQHVGVRDGKVERILVFFGGIDAANHTGRAITALASLGGSNFHVDVVIGIQHPQREKIKADCMARGYACHVQTDRMAQLIASADMAIGAGGATTWERCCLGLPTLAISVAANQRRQIDDAAREGLLYVPDLPEQSGPSLALHVKALLDNAALRTMLSSNGMRHVDGRGVSRVVNRLGASRIEMRKATADDSRSLFDWRNHDAIRAVSRSDQLIQWQDHQKWLDSVLTDADRNLLIGTLDGSPVGVVRYDCGGGKAEISIYLVPGMLSAGYGAELLQSAEQWLRLNRQDVHSISAHVLGNNPRSAKLFMNAGYAVEPTCFIKRLSI